MQQDLQLFMGLFFVFRVEGERVRKTSLKVFCHRSAGLLGVFGSYGAEDHRVLQMALWNWRFTCEYLE